MSKVLLFDGVCILCHRFVRFMIQRDPGSAFRFASQQSDAGRRLLERAGFSASGLQDTMVLVEGEWKDPKTPLKGYVRSTAALRIFANLGLPWSLLYAGIVLPAPLRDAVYNFLASKRYAWFGRTDEPGAASRLLACPRPSGEERKRNCGFFKAAAAASEGP
eukprot:tig00021135_g18941.t1